MARQLLWKVEMAEIGNRGKRAEKEVETLLKQWNSSVGFAYWRLPDSRSARNYLASQPGDFAYFCNGRGGIIEVKESQNANFRVAKDKISQLPTLKKLNLAGAKSLVLVYFSAEALWKVVHPGLLALDVPSWSFKDADGFPTAEAALLSTGFFEGVS